MNKRLWVLWATSIACGPDPIELDGPRIASDHVLYGTAQTGRSINPGSIRVRPTSEVAKVAPDAIAGDDIDMVYAGLSTEDLPIGLGPEMLEFVTEQDDRARPLPNLRDVHVLEEPSPSDDPAPLVPVVVSGAPKSLLDDREFRLHAMLADVRLKNPCREPTTKFNVTTPRIPGDAIVAMHTQSDQKTILGLSVNSTIAFGRIDQGRTEVDLIPVVTGTVALVENGESAIVRYVSTEEIESAEYGPLPADLTVEIVGGFGTAGLALRWSAARGRYLDVTPRLADAFPRALFGQARVELPSGPAFCAYGGVQGASRRAAIWCQQNGSNTWEVTGDFPRSFAISRVISPPGEAPIAFDLAGSVYELVGAQWVVRSSSRINEGCDPLCASFTTTAVPTAAASIVGVLAGARAQLLVVSAGAEAQSVQLLTDSLFLDERAESETALRFSTAEIAPDGSIFLGTTRPDLLRIDAARTKVERICLPKGLRDTPMSAIEAHPDGRLYLGMAPALLAFGRWDDL